MDLQETLRLHRLWVLGDPGGKRADLSCANLSCANLYRANLSCANLYSANLSGANLSCANLSSANLYRANLSGANLSGANLYCANLYRADLSGAKLSGAKLNWSAHAALSEILYVAAKNNIRRQMLAAFIGRKTEWCWVQFSKLKHPDRNWAIRTLAVCVRPNDGAPAIIRSVHNRMKKAKSRRKAA